LCWWRGSRRQKGTCADGIEAIYFGGRPRRSGKRPAAGGEVASRRNDMAWTTPKLIEICAGLEINGYLPAEF